MRDITIFVYAFADFRVILGTQTEVVLTQGRTLTDLLEVLSDSYEGFRGKVFNSEGQLSEGMGIIVNGHNVGHMKSPKLELRDGDQVYFFRSLSGG